jgi:glycine hydroxymethyltransferase
LERQQRLLAASIVLTPVDSLPLVLGDRQATAFLHGLYLTDKVRDRAAQKDAAIQFARRGRAARDLAAVHDLFAAAFATDKASLRMLSGLHAHAATFMSIAKVGDVVMLLSDEGGGHFSTPAILERLGLPTVPIPLDRQRLCIDQRATRAEIDTTRPAFLLVDRSEGLRYEELSFLGAVEGPVKVFDASQYLAQIVTGRYPNPLDWGFDLALFSLHKSFPGPQKAGIVGRCEDALWAQLITGLSTLVSSSHAESTYLAGLTLLEPDALGAYVDRMLATALALERELLATGVPVVERSRQGDPAWPTTQHLWVQAQGRDEAFAWYEALARVRVHTNYRVLPYGLGHGLRLGTTYAAAAGLEPGDAPELAWLVGQVLRTGPTADLRHEVRSLAGRAASRVFATTPP